MGSTSQFALCASCGKIIDKEYYICKECRERGI